MTRPGQCDESPTPASHTCAGADGQCGGLALQGLGLAYGRQQAFRDVDLQIPACRITALVGPSGCGKSSLLKCLNRLDEEEPDARVSGRVLLDGADIRAPGSDLTALRRQVGMIFQQPSPFPLSIRANLDLPLREHGVRGRAERDSRIERALHSVGLWSELRDRLNASATGLSGGQQQRLCLARALVLSPRIVLLDEPSSSLDPLAAAVIEELIASLRGFYTVVLVTHDLSLAARLADVVAVLWPGESGGRLVATGGPELLRRPDSVLAPPVQRYLASATLTA